MRTLLIVAGLALPIVVFVALSQSTSTVLKSKPAKVTASVEKAEPAPKIEPDSKNPVKATGSTTKMVSAPSVILPKLSKKKPEAATKKGYMSLEQATQKVKARLDKLRGMTQADWPAERRRHANAPATLKQAIDYNRNRLAQLMRMDTEQWEAEQRGEKPRQPTRAPTRKTTWDNLTEQEKLGLVREQQERLNALRKKLENKMKSKNPTKPEPKAKNTKLDVLTQPRQPTPESPSAINSKPVDVSRTGKEAAKP